MKKDIILDDVDDKLQRYSNIEIEKEIYEEYISLASSLASGKYSHDAILKMTSYVINERYDRNYSDNEIKKLYLILKMKICLLIKTVNIIKNL